MHRPSAVVTLTVLVKPCRHLADTAGEHQKTGFVSKAENEMNSLVKNFELPKLNGAVMGMTEHATLYTAKHMIAVQDQLRHACSAFIFITCIIISSPSIEVASKMHPTLRSPVRPPQQHLRFLCHQQSIQKGSA